MTWRHTIAINSPKRTIRPKDWTNVRQIHNRTLTYKKRTQQLLGVVRHFESSPAFKGRTKIVMPPWGYCDWWLLAVSATDTYPSACCICDLPIREGVNLRKNQSWKCEGIKTWFLLWHVILHAYNTVCQFCNFHNFNVSYIILNCIYILI